MRISCIVEKCWKIVFHLKVDRKHDILMVSALAFSARDHGFDPRSRREKNSVSKHAFLSVQAWLDKCAVLRIGTLTGGQLCRESHPMCRLKNPAVAFILQNRCVQRTPAHYPQEIHRIGTLTGGPLCRKSRSLYRLKNPTVVYMTTCRLSFCKPGVYNICLFIILERGCSSMYRKKKDSISHMLKSRY